MLIELFKTEERVRVLRYVMFRSSLSVAEVSRATEVTKGLVSRYLRLLVEYDLLQKEGRVYSPHDGANSRAVKLLLNLERIDLSALSLGSARGLGLYGSWARGTNHQESDLDVCDIQPRSGFTRSREVEKLVYFRPHCTSNRHLLHNTVISA